MVRSPPRLGPSCSPAAGVVSALPASLSSPPPHPTTIAAASAASTVVQVLPVTRPSSWSRATLVEAAVATTQFRLGVAGTTPRGDVRESARALLAGGAARRTRVREP